jgi:hypothetical protein
MEYLTSELVLLNQAVKAKTTKPSVPDYLLKSTTYGDSGYFE